jgi:hypothetical protein
LAVAAGLFGIVVGGLVRDWPARCWCSGGITFDRDSGTLLRDLR